MARQLFTPEQRQTHVNQWEASDLSQRAYCKQQGIKESTFKNWLDPKRSNNGPAFAPVILPSTSGKPLTIDTPNGFRIEIPIDEDSEKLHLVFQALGIADAY